MACLLLPTQCLNIDDSIYYNERNFLYPKKFDVLPPNKERTAKASAYNYLINKNWDRKNNLKKRHNYFTILCRIILFM